MTIRETREGSLTLVRLQGRLDAASAPETDRRLAALIHGGARQVVLDLSGVEYVSSAGLRVFLAAAKRMQQAHGKLGLASPTSQVRQILDMAGFAAVLPVFGTMAQAVADCAGVKISPPRAASVPAAAPVPAGHGLLSFAEEIYLLALDGQRGVLKPLPASALDYALAGAVLMELAIQGRIDTDLDALKVTSSTPTANPLLDETLRKLQQKPEPQPTSVWLKRLADQSERIEARVLTCLVQRGILKKDNRRILWVFEVCRYPLIDNREIKEVRSRLRELILSDDIPDPRDIVLISMGSACQLLDDLFQPEECGRARARIRALARLDLIGREMSHAVREIERAMAVVMANLQL